MSIPKVIDDVMLYVSGAMTRIFGLNDDSYPATGIQPYEGEPNSKKHRSD